ncbi:MAG: tetratricopeptide repeat protein [Acidobacteriales bacterium]|nr:tetratricopeptide repeat protein [Terriglobales bacterium]
MKIPRFSILFILCVTLGMSTAPAWGVSKETIQLQTEVKALQDQMSRMQQSFDERMGVMKNLLDQNTDSINKVAAAIVNMQTIVQKQQAESGGHVDQLSGQIQSLNDSLDELKVRLAKVSKQLEDMQAAQQNVTTQAATPGIQSPQVQAPSPDVLYNNALRDYNAAKNDIAVQEFSDYIKYYPTTDLAGNSYFYLAEIEYRQGNFKGAIADYDQVLQNFPSGNKAAAAQLKKGFALLETGQKDQGISELRHLIQRYPRTNEAVQARERLHKLGVAATTARR